MICLLKLFSIACFFVWGWEVGDVRGSSGVGGVVGGGGRWSGGGPSSMWVPRSDFKSVFESRVCPLTYVSIHNARKYDSPTNFTANFRTLLPST